MRRYRVDIIQYNENNRIDSLCNEIAFINTGTTNMFIKKYLIVPGQSLNISGNNDEIDITAYDLSFTGGVGNCTVVRKFYV